MRCKLNVSPGSFEPEMAWLVLTLNQTARTMIISTKQACMPDFLIIGAGKSGTTSLDNYLRQHPQIYVPPVKEPNFFGYEQVSPEDLTPGERMHYEESVTSLDAYQALFADATEDQIKGETSNTYLYHDTAPARIEHYNPDMKLIAILRQPAKRLYSRYLHLARDGRLPTPHFDDCLDRNSVWWTRNDLIPEGFYYHNLSRYYEHFPASQIRVYLYDDFQRSGEAVMTDIFSFLGVNAELHVNQEVRYNQSGVVKHQWLQRIIGNHGFIQNTSKKILGRRYQSLKESVWMQKIVNKVRNKNLARPEMNPKVYQFLTREVYREDLLKLQDLIGKDLSKWME